MLVCLGLFFLMSSHFKCEFKMYHISFLILSALIDMTSTANTFWVLIHFKCKLTQGPQNSVSGALENPMEDKSPWSPDSSHPCRLT